MDDYLVLKNCKIIGSDSISEPTDILIKNDIIFDIGSFPAMKGYDIKGNYISAGFVDIHTHGGNGSDFMDATGEAFDNVLKYHLKHGTTSVVATSLTSSRENIDKFLEQTRRYLALPQKYACLLGVHLEGPFLSLKGCGAQNPAYLLNPKKDDYQFILDNKDIVKTVTIAPELDVDGVMTRTLSENGILVSGGHDDGVYPEFMPAIHAGLRHLTHIYCAMSGFGTKAGTREIGLREYGLLDNSLSCEIIADNIHITAKMAELIIKCKGADKVALVSDTLRCAGMPADNRLYSLGNENDSNSLRVRVSNGIAMLEDGSKFAGSITSVHEMVKNLISAGIPVIDAFKMGTSTPAKIIGEKNIGIVKKGFIANLCELNENFNIISVYMRGKRIESI